MMNQHSRSSGRFKLPLPFARGFFLVLVLVLASLPPTSAQPERSPEETEKIVETTGAQVQFIGLQSVSEREVRFRLADQLLEIRKEGLTRPLADDTAFFVELLLRRLGFTEAEVLWEIKGSHLLLTITEGPRTFIGKTEFTGDVKLDPKILLDYLIGATRERLPGFTTRYPYVDADIEDGVNRIRAYYLSEGYLESKIAKPIVTFSEDRATADIEVPIQAGPQYRFGAVNLSGNLIFPEREILEQIKQQLEKPYTELNLDTMRRQLEYFYTGKGYYFAKVEASQAPAKNYQVPTRFFITPGSYYTFDGITVTGLKKLKESFLQKRFRHLKGKKYNPQSIDKTYREVMQTGLFDRLTVGKTPVPGNQIRLDLSAEEAKTSSFGIYGGVATYDGLILGFSYENRNLFATGRPLKTSLEITLRGISGEIEYKDPWWFDSDFQFTSRLFATNTRYVGYTSFSIGERVEIKRKITRHFEATAFGQYKHVLITEHQIQRVFLGPEEYPLATGGLALTYDKRDNAINPTKGWVINAASSYNNDLEDSEFIRVTGGGSIYHSFGPVLLAAGARYGTLITSSFVGDIPITERFFNGGATTVRSFPEYELGPLDDDNYPIGGLTFTVFNVECDFPLFDSLRGAVFFDAGSISFESGEMVPEDLRYAIGVGLRYQLPIGPVRLDYGFNPDPRSYEPFGALHFSFGFAF